MRDLLRLNIARHPIASRVAHTVLAAVSAAVFLALAAPRSAVAVAFEIERVDGDSVSISSQLAFALGSDGTPHVAYAYDSEGARYARKTNGSWAYERIDFGFFAEGAYPSMRLDAASNPRIVYQLINLQSPLYVRKSGGAWIAEVPQVAEQSGLYISMRLDSQDLPHFTDFVGGLTYMIRYHRRVGAGWITETVEFVNDIGVSGSALALDANDDAHVTYNGPGGVLRYARRTGGAWTIETLDPGGGIWSPIEIDANGNACVAYTAASGIRYARRTGGAWSIETAVTNGVFGFSTLSLALDAQDEPHMTYAPGFSGDLHYARREAGAWIEEVVLDTTNSVGYTNVLVLDSDGRPHIVFGDGTAADVLYAHPPSTTGVERADARSRAARLVIAPNPSRDGSVVIRVDGDGAFASPREARPIGIVEALIADTSGRVVRRLSASAAASADVRFAWDGRDSDGRAVGTGNYFVRVAGAMRDHTPAAGKLLILR
ncbi:MAG: FlgD immunoglobulin-like domain containing protein [bacterium]